ncbi:penicillin-binding transpeptidase domain-containing protein [Carboxylicivirga caseinilyticus]|uniref:penicillin-binding transpeptidase domain-containing protein n=1 Tax=Carboxylicivirga caseinilyticus TaxID=3417572 RepID=UPI003D32A490|nr:class D beta-lactamase [Marinilabiliaceae bacterium A049]
MKVSHLNFIFVVFLCLSLQLKAQPKDIEIAKLFKGTKGCFVISKFDNSEHYYFNKDQAQERFSPCSTFKIPNSLIALQTGVASGIDYVIEWDSIRNPHEAWMNEKEPFKYWCQNHTMKSAFKYSVVWYYQEIARKIGEIRMQQAIISLDYGNKDISSALDRFWLCGSLEISAIEQTQFLRKLYNEKLVDFSKENIQKVKAIMLYEEGDDYKLFGKTGGGNCSADKVIGWYVGFVETQKGPYVFAMNMLADDFKQFDNNRRIETVKEILKILGYI